jgi:hypothetical protein
MGEEQCIRRGALKKCAGGAVDRRAEEVVGGGVANLELLDAGASGSKATDEELESVRKRKVQLVEELKSLDDYLQDSKDYVGLNLPDFI